MLSSCPQGWGDAYHLFHTQLWQPTIASDTLWITLYIYIEIAKPLLEEKEKGWPIDLPSSWHAALRLCTFIWLAIFFKIFSTYNSSLAWIIPYMQHNGLLWVPLPIRRYLEMFGHVWFSQLGRVLLAFSGESMQSLQIILHDSFPERSQLKVSTVPGSRNPAQLTS
jgi:hypothetical protein